MVTKNRKKKEKGKRTIYNGILLMKKYFKKIFFFKTILTATNYITISFHEYHLYHSLYVLRKDNVNRVCARNLPLSGKNILKKFSPIARIKT